MTNRPSVNQQFPGDHIKSQDGELTLGGHRLTDLAKTYGTPLYAYDFSRIRARCDELTRELGQDARGSRAFYAVKALGNLSVLRLISSAGLGMDVVSGGEIERCLAAGIPAEDIIFSGVAKSRAEVELGVRAGISSFNIESPHEVGLIQDIAQTAGKIISVAIRFNPDIDGDTHDKINTGLAETKFGLNIELAKRVAHEILSKPNLRLTGLTCHIGSQIFDMGNVLAAARRSREFALWALAQGAPISHIDMGGGLAVAYSDKDLPRVPSFRDWIAAAREALPNDKIALHVEPGRAIVADSGVLLTEVIDTKESGGKNFALCDAGMTELVRPAMYEAYHHIMRANHRAGDHEAIYDVVGPVCETSCALGYDMRLKSILKGDILAVLTSGAYGMSMASNYNSRPRPAEIAIDGKIARVIRQRETLSSLWDSERIQ
jgi:diaminopimelate decarboxylase